MERESITITIKSMKGWKRPKFEDFINNGDFVRANVKWIDDNFDLELYLKPWTILSDLQQDDLLDYYITDPREIHKWPEEATRRLKKMDYTEFLSTGYWQSISSYVKMMAGYVCEVCGRNEDQVKLHTHHLSYQHLGCEINHLSDLQCICKDCHENLHRGYEE